MCASVVALELTHALKALHVPVYKHMRAPSHAGEASEAADLDAATADPQGRSELVRSALSEARYSEPKDQAGFCRGGGGRGAVPRRVNATRLETSFGPSLTR